MILLKLGGSLLTDKKTRFSLKGNVLDRVAEEIKEGTKDDLILIHGGGSFGHPIASDYNLQDGIKNEEQLRGVALTREAMGEFNNRVVSALVKHGINAISVQPSAAITCNSGRIESFNTDILKGLLRSGMVPVLYGDVVLDSSTGFCILSGDQIISYLAGIFKPNKIILGVDVDGIFSRNPKKYRDAKLVDEVTPSNLMSVLEAIGAQENDVTSGMRGKLVELVKLAARDFESQIVNAAEKGRLKKVLLGEEVIGTKIRRGNYDRF